MPAAGGLSRSRAARPGSPLPLRTWRTRRIRLHPRRLPLLPWRPLSQPGPAQVDPPEGTQAVFAAAPVEEGMALARDLEPERPESAEEEPRLETGSVLRLAVDAEPAQGG